MQCSTLVTALVAITFQLVGSEEICCPPIGCFTDDYPFDDVPLPICTDEMNLFYLLYTSQNISIGDRFMRNSPIPSSFNSSSPTVFMAGGWNDGGQSSWQLRMREALASTGNFNFITINWEEGADDLFYPQSASNTRTAGADAGFLSRRLVEESGTNRADIMCVAFSLGAHVCGHLGKAYTIGRISGLDPAGPWFDDGPTELGLWKDDANVVDVIHTMGKDHLFPLGAMKQMGDSDFYPNAGGVQPGCDELGGCSHGRAVSLYIESITNTECQFTAVSNCTDVANIPSSCSPCTDCPQMGYYNDNPVSGFFYLTTGGAEGPPYCSNTVF